MPRNVQTESRNLICRRQGLRSCRCSKHSPTRARTHGRKVRADRVMVERELKVGGIRPVADFEHTTQEKKLRPEGVKRYARHLGWNLIQKGVI